MSLFRLAIVFTLVFTGSVIAKSEQDMRTITVSGVGEVISTPDLFSFSVHIEEKGQQASVLNKIITKKTSEVVNTLVTMGVDKKAIQSLQVRFNPWVEYEHKKNVQKGFSLTRKINITLDKLEQYDHAIDALLKIGITRIDSFSSSDSKIAENYKKALDSALLNARARAADMASTLDLKIDKVISISEHTSGRSAPIQMDTAGLRAFKESSYQPGEMSTQARVQVVFTIKDF